MHLPCNFKHIWDISNVITTDLPLHICTCKIKCYTSNIKTQSAAGHGCKLHRLSPTARSEKSKYLGSSTTARTVRFPAFFFFFFFFFVLFLLMSFPTERPPVPSHRLFTLHLKRLFDSSQMRIKRHPAYIKCVQYNMWDSWHFVPFYELRRRLTAGSTDSTTPLTSN